ncbi:MAG: hypothetical protein KDD65_00960 [Bacteroidetes bacterium]|nr:hypothetical protein [Bacteroidota bacterium]
MSLLSFWRVVLLSFCHQKERKQRKSAGWFFFLFVAKKKGSKEKAPGWIFLGRNGWISRRRRGYWPRKIMPGCLGWARERHPEMAGGWFFVQRRRPA